ncbi:hypothetical protein LTR09_012060 [Extremus antarcticus]|uniref:Uncharacterized protein n=1 Tax=Extremus antarcticus TaxID=702011 RepID=A0AAJ0D5Q9_9PEZI|nr:hypothetical protein LTR09_012060 [Extremus antarcticus]
MDVLWKLPFSCEDNPTVSTSVYDTEGETIETRIDLPLSRLPTLATFLENRGGNVKQVVVHFFLTSDLDCGNQREDVKLPRDCKFNLKTDLAGEYSDEKCEAALDMLRALFVSVASEEGLTAAVYTDEETHWDWNEGGSIELISFASPTTPGGQIELQRPD